MIPGALRLTNLTDSWKSHSRTRIIYKKHLTRISQVPAKLWYNWTIVSTWPFNKCLFNAQILQAAHFLLIHLNYFVIHNFVHPEPLSRNILIQHEKIRITDHHLSGSLTINLLLLPASMKDNSSCLPNISFFSFTNVLCPM